MHVNIESVLKLHHSNTRPWQVPRSVSIARASMKES